MPDGAIQPFGMRTLRAATTPARLRRFMLATAVLAALAGAVALWAAATVREAAQTVGRDAEPSVALALRMAATLSDMNAAALADSLIDAGAAAGTSAPFRAATLQLTRDLVEAARNITYGEAEAVPLRELQRWALAYQEAVAESRSYGQGDAWVTAHRVQWASRVNRDFAAPWAEALASANADELERRYAAYRSGAALFGGAAPLVFALLVAELVAAQLYLARRMRRTVNPLLAAATLVALGAGVWFGAAVLGDREDLRAAKSDAYDSLKVLFQAKAAANELRADMSLWLLDSASRPAALARMEQTARALLGPDLFDPARAGPSRTALGRALQLENDGDPAGALKATPHLGGFLGVELDNITFGMAERVPATESVQRLLDATAVARAVRAEEAGRGHAEVVARWLGQRPGEGAASFASLQATLDRTIAVNQSEFDRRSASALATARAMPFVTTGALVLATLLAVGGLWQRLREYR